MSVAKNTLFLTISLVFSKVLSFIYFAVVARYLGVEMTGAYTFALSLTTLCAIVSDFGVTPYITRLISSGQGNARLFGATIIAKFLLIIAAVCLVTGIGAWSSYEDLILQLLPFATVVMVLDAMQVFFYGILRGLQVLKYESVGMMSGQVVSLVFGVTGLWFGFGAVWLIGGLMLGSLLQVVLSWTVVARNGVFRSIAFPTFADVRSVISGSFSFGLAGVFSRGYSQIDLVLLQHFTTLAAVGVYAVASKIVFSLQFVPIALSASLFPALAKVTHNTEETQRLLKGGFHYLMMVCVPLSLYLVLFAEPILLAAFGETYRDAVLPLQVLAVSLLFGFLDYPLGAYLNGSGKAHLQTLSMGVTLVVNVLANMILISRFGALGAALAALLAQGVLFSCGFMFARHIVKGIVSELSATFLKIFFASIVAGFGAYLVSVVMEISVIAFLSFSSSFGILYAVLLLLLRVFSVTDFLKALR